MKNSENRCLCGVVKPGQQMSSFPMFVQWKPWWPLSHSFIQISRESTLLALICVHVCVCHSGTSKPISRIAANLKRISLHICEVSALFFALTKDMGALGPSIKDERRMTSTSVGREGLYTALFVYGCCLQCKRLRYLGVLSCIVFTITHWHSCWPNLHIVAVMSFN